MDATIYESSPAFTDKGSGPPTAQPQSVQHVAGSNNQIKRRRRAAIACPSCRSRKTKCDHILPKQGDDYLLGGIPRSSQAYIRYLERRLQKYEEVASDQREFPRAVGQMDAWSLAPKRDLTGLNAFDLSPSQSGRKDSIVIADSPEIFMGGASGLSFTQLILNAMNRTDSSRLQHQTFSSPRDYQNITSSADIYALPSDAHDLINIFIDFNHVLSPVFHVPTILSKFERVFACDDSSRPEHSHILAIMNMIFAIATSHKRHGTETSISTSRRYYDRAMALIGPTLFFDWSIEKVQILLLGARYLQSSNFPDECWNVLGLAIRIGYGVQLHRTPGEHLNYIEKETWKRVWYACYGLDQLLSMIYGRPAATSSATFNTPLPEDLDDDCIQPNRLLFPNLKTPSMVSFSLQVSKLYRLLESAASLVDPPLETLAQLDEEFELWYSDVPDHLKLREDSQVQDDKLLILALRANMVRILIHRQSLVSTLTTLSKSGRGERLSQSLKTSMLQNSRRICVRTAEDIIHLVGHRYDQTKNAVGPSWFNLYYLFNAILILVSHVIDPEYHDDKAALGQLDRAMQMIRQMSTNHLCAQRAYSFLQQLLGFMDKSLTVDGRRITGWARPQGPVTPTPGDEGSAVMENGNEDLSQPDIFAFWDITQDLTSNLGSQLESYSALGSGTWSWGMEEPSSPGVYASDTATGRMP